MSLPLPLIRNLSRCVSYKWKLCNAVEKKKRNLLPSVASSQYTSEDSLSLTTPTAENPQITGSYFIISCRPVPRLSPPTGLGDMWRERQRREWEISEKTETLERHAVDGRKECTACVTWSGVSFCWGRKHCARFTFTECEYSQIMSSHEHPGHPEGKEGEACAAVSEVISSSQASWCLSLGVWHR